MRKALLTILCLGHLNIYAQWQDCSLDLSNNLNAVQFIDDRHGWIVGDRGLILKYDKGSWISIDSEFSTYNLTELFFTDSIHGWIIGSDGLILKYDNDTISSVSSPTKEYLFDIYMINKNYGWISGGRGTILKYSENIWSVYTTDRFSLGIGLTDLQFLDSTFGILMGSHEIGFTILDYENGEWYENSSSNGYAARGLYIKDKENIFTTANQYSMKDNPSNGRFINYNSLTGTFESIGDIGRFAWGCEIAFGETMGWAISYMDIFKYEVEYRGEYKVERFVKYENHATITNSLNSIYIENDSTGWIVGDNGTILKYNSQLTHIPDIKKEIIEIYPNPFQDFLIIKSATPIIYIEVFSTSGAKIDSRKVNHESSIEYNFMNSPIGMYFLKIKTEDSEYIQKVIKN